MRSEQLAAYESLCAKVPEAKHCDLRCCRHSGEWYVLDAPNPIDSAFALATLTAHLEAMLPAKTKLEWPHFECDQFVYEVKNIGGVFTLRHDPDRFIALCRAVEASR